MNRLQIDGDAPPAGSSAAIQALWWDARGHWERAHACVADDEGRDAAWVHAYLHRKEGDAGNAGYWYARAGRPRCTEPLAREWQAIVDELAGSV